MLAVGLMSGTSLDGVDAALVRIAPRGESYALELLNFAMTPFADDLAIALRAALPPNPGSIAQVAALHRRLGFEFADAAKSVLDGKQPDYVASHGLTIWHDGAAQTTLQIGDAFVLRAALGASVCYDFRSADCAAGGQGAPLVPYVDALLLSDPHEDRVAVNIGGIANLTALPRGCAPQDVIAFDSGPGNMLIDALVRERTDGAACLDRDGAFARAGSIDLELVRVLLSDPYFAQAAPKSTGREYFGAGFLQQHAAAFAGLSLEDAAATLTELTAASLANAIASLGLGRARVVVSGGGAHNGVLLDRLRARLSGVRVETSDAVGLPVDAKEAIAFAVLGYETLRARAANLPRVTGAKRSTPLGAIAPFELAQLLTNVERECRAS